MSESKTTFKQKLGKFWDSIAHNPSFTIKEQLGYAAGIGGNSMAQDVEAFALTLFLTNFMGIKAIFVLFLQLLAKLSNIIIDPICGAILDKPSKKGMSKTKAFTLISPIPLAVSSVILFIVPNLDQTEKIIYVFVFYLIYCFADSFYDMALNTVSARMSTNPKDRKNFYTVGTFASTLGGMLPSGLIPVFISLYAGYDEEIYLIFAIVFAVLGLALMLVPPFTLKEKTRAAYLKEPPVKLNMKALLLNRPLWCVILSNILDSIRQVCYSGLTYLYLETMGSLWISSAAGVISATLSYLGLAAVPIICNKWSSRDVIAAGYFYTGIWYVIFLIVGYKVPFLVMLIVGFAGLPNGAMSACRTILTADSTDYMEYMTWKKYGTPVRSEGMVFALRSMAGRLQGFWKSLLLPAGLAVIGYVSAITFGSSTIKIVQNEEALNGIFYLVVLSGLVGNFLPGAVMLLDNYTGKRKEAILKELNEMRAKAQADWDKEHANAPVEA